jgi:hypothetical protein
VIKEIYMNKLKINKLCGWVYRNIVMATGAYSWVRGQFQGSKKEV